MSIVSSRFFTPTLRSQKSLGSACRFSNESSSCHVSIIADQKQLRLNRIQMRKKNHNQTMHGFYAYLMSMAVCMNE